jgi:hypothetical protein
METDRRFHHCCPCNSYSFPNEAKTLYDLLLGSRVMYEAKRDKARHGYSLTPHSDRGAH